MSPQKFILGLVKEGGDIKSLFAHVRTSCAHAYIWEFELSYPFLVGVGWAQSGVKVRTVEVMGLGSCYGGGVCCGGKGGVDGMWADSLLVVAAALGSCVAARMIV